MKWKAGTWSEAIYSQENHANEVWVDEGPLRANLPSELSVVQRDGSIRGVRLA
jgi:hypothetical protein